MPVLLQGLFRMNEPAAKKSKFDAEDGEIFSEIEDASDMEDGEICSDDDVTELLKTGKNLSSTPKKVKTLPKINSEYTKGIVLVRQGDQKQPAAIILPPTKARVFNKKNFGLTLTCARSSLSVV